MLKVIVSTSAASRLAAATEFLSTQPPAAEVTIIGASRGAADDLARAVALRSGATFGITRFSLTQLAAHAASVSAVGARRVPGTQAGAEAVAARAVFDTLGAGELSYFTPVATMPGFPKALARTLHEIRLGGIGTDVLTGSGAAADDIARLLARVEEQLDRAAVDDRAALFRMAAHASAAGHVRWAKLPIVLLDMPLDSRAEREFVAALTAQSPHVLATVPDDDLFAREALAALGGDIEVVADSAVASSDLANLRRYVFTRDRPTVRPPAGDVRLFSAPGEGREAVEIVRRALDEAARGVPFDDMAVFLRTPEQYLGLLEHACARGGVPVYFDRGTRRPDPSGRAFVALLSCAVEGLSAKRFDEYLSLGQVPRVDDRHSGARPADAGLVVLPRDDVFGGRFDAASADRADEDVFAGDQQTVLPPDSDDDAVVAGTLRSPWKWEELIVESAVVGGRSREDGRARWRRRLDGLAADYQIRIGELAREEPESARIRRYERDLRNLRHLRAFALPIVDTLASWPDRATWGAWLEHFAELTARALRRPERVLANTRGSAADGRHRTRHDRRSARRPARSAGHARLGASSAALRAPLRRHGASGARPRLPSRVRSRAGGTCGPSAPARGSAAAGRAPHRARRCARHAGEAGKCRAAAAEDRDRCCSRAAVLSYPRLDVAETRARVPSFYALDVVRAITGQVPDHRVLATDAAEEGGASLGWPAPKDPDAAIDDLEHDLAVLKPLLDARDPSW